MNDEKNMWNKYKRRYAAREYLKYRYGQVYHCITQKSKEWDISPLENRKLLTDQEAAIEIANAIKMGKPYFVGRFGHTEMNFIARILGRRINGSEGECEQWLDALCKNAGFFPKDTVLSERYVDIMIESCKEVDVQAIWNLYMEDYMLDKYAPAAKTMRLRSIEPWVKYRIQYMEELPWSSALKGKNVLIVHPFVDSIQNQYFTRRQHLFEKIYEADVILPEFNLKVVKAVQTIANNTDDRFCDWFEALEWMYNECMCQNFDIALIGCGAYGYPLAAKIKKAGKIAIHMGGSLQLMFGIMGNRWESDELFCKRVLNNSWTKPSEVERPVGLGTIENGCYW